MRDEFSHELNALIQKYIKRGDSVQRIECDLERRLSLLKKELNQKCELNDIGPPIGWLPDRSWSGPND